MIGTSPRRWISRLLVLTWIGTSLGAGASLMAREPTPDRFKGRALSAALATLQQDGLRVVFSSDLVRADMIVADEPRGRWPHEILDELLAPHGLRSKRGPAGTLLIVKAPPPGRVTPTTRAALPVKPASTLSRTEPRRPIYHEDITVREHDPSSRQDRPEARERLGEHDLSGLPAVGRDALLPIARLAGAATSEGATGVNVRGGSGREAKIVLDGLELYEPYHLKDRGGPIGLIDPRTLGGVQLLGGAFPAEHGGALSAVVEMETLAPSKRVRGEVSIGLDETRGAFAGVRDRARWFVSLRRGDSSRLLHTLGADPSYHPSYWDALAKADYRLGDDTTLSIHLLGGDDEVEGGGYDDVIETVREPGTFKALHTNRYAWLALRRTWTPRLFSEMVISNGLLTNDRHGSDPRVVAVSDARSTGVFGVKQDWLWQSSRHLVKWGLDVKALRATYDYTSTRTTTTDSFGALSRPAIEPMAIATSPDGREVGVYLADRLHVSRRLQVEVGLRHDVHSYTPDRDGSLDPRANAVYAVGDKTTVRVGWGYFSQPQRIDELDVEDGVRVFQRAERAEHSVLSLAHEFGRGVEAQVNVYQKRIDRVSPRYENLFDPFGFFPEATSDRVSVAPQAARADGLELVVRRAARQQVGWWTSYALARTEDDIDGQWVARKWDQRHTLNAGVDWSPDDKWDLGLSATVHSGRPTTPLSADLRRLPDGRSTVVLLPGPRNSERLSPYARLDLRVSRSIRIRGSDFKATLSVTGASARENDCCLADFALTTTADGAATVDRRPQWRPPPLATFGLSWAF